MLFGFAKPKRAKPLILHADDDAISHALITAMVQELGYDCMAAANGMEAFQLAEKLLPDVILMDVNMPIMDGIEACRIIKLKATTKHIPVIMLTSMDMVKDVDKAMAAGANAYLCKPVDMPLLQAKLTAVIPPPPPA